MHGKLLECNPCSEPCPNQFAIDSSRKVKSLQFYCIGPDTAAQGHKKPKAKLHNCLMVWDTIDLCPLGWLCWEWQFELSVTQQGAFLTCQETWHCSKGAEIGQDMHRGASSEERDLLPLAPFRHHQDHCGKSYPSQFAHIYEHTCMNY